MNYLKLWMKIFPIVIAAFFIIHIYNNFDEFKTTNTIKGEPVAQKTSQSRFAVFTNASGKTYRSKENKEFKETPIHIFILVDDVNEVAEEFYVQMVKKKIYPKIIIRPENKESILKSNISLDSRHFKLGMKFMKSTDKYGEVWYDSELNKTIKLYGKMDINDIPENLMLYVHFLDNTYWKLNKKGM